MECNEAAILFESIMNTKVVNIERCSAGIANFVFVVSLENSKFILRCNKNKEAYIDTVYLLSHLSKCNIPIPHVLKYGEYRDYSYIILSYIEGNDIGNIYDKLNDNEKKKIAKDVIAVQRNVSKVDITANKDWNWNSYISGMLDRSCTRIIVKKYFDVEKVDMLKILQKDIQSYLDSINPIPYLDDISTKNLLINNGTLSGIIDIDWLGFGDVLTFVALTRVSLLNMELDTKYIDYLLEELHPSEIEYRAFIFYCLISCVDFMGERGMQFLDKTIPVDENVIRRLNNIYDELLEQWYRC